MVRLLYSSVFTIFLWFYGFLTLQAQENNPKSLSLPDVLQIASDSSLTAFRYKNMYLASYWQYRSYLAGRRPTVAFNATPFNYNRALTKRYDYAQNIDVYREQQLLNSEANLSVSQNFTPTGGNFYASSDLGRLQNLGTKTSLDYSITPVKHWFCTAPVWL
jgi:hypothetical protein